MDVPRTVRRRVAAVTEIKRAILRDVDAGVLPATPDSLDIARYAGPLDDESLGSDLLDDFVADVRDEVADWLESRRRDREAQALANVTRRRLGQPERP